MHVRELAPFVWNPRGSGFYVHRPRSATIHDDRHNFRNCRPRYGSLDRSARLTVHAWCGQMIHVPAVSDFMPPGREICATCEGRATANGHAPIDGGPVDPRLAFHPRKFQEWDAPVARYYQSGYRAP